MINAVGANPSKASEERLKILLLCSYDPYNAAMVTDHINAFHLYSLHNIFVYSGLVFQNGNLPRDLDLKLFDVVVVHYSVFLSVDAYISHYTRQMLKSFTGIKVIFLQDEYRFVDATVENISNIGFNIVFTCVPDSAIGQVYPQEKLPGVKFINVLTGYIPASLLSCLPIPLSKRKYDVSYRGRRYPVWHGRLGMEKWQIADYFHADARKYKLKTNISYQEKDRVYGANWINLIRQSRAVLGVESGSSVFDFSGQVSAKVDTFIALTQDVHPNKLIKQYFSDLEDKISFAQISPRIFEAIALRTLCILYEGNYSGVIEPWRHYIPLKKDHSNMDEIAKLLTQPFKIAEIITNAYTEIAINPQYSYQTFIQKFDILTYEAVGQCEGRIARKEELAFKRLKNKYPFFFMANPHMLNSLSIEAKLKQLLKKAIPISWLKI